MTNPVGQRLKCETCGSQLIITQPGEGTVTCCDQPMVSTTAAPGTATPPAG